MIIIMKLKLFSGEMKYIMLSEIMPLAITMLIQKKVFRFKYLYYYRIYFLKHLQ